MQIWTYYKDKKPLPHVKVNESNNKKVNLTNLSHTTYNKISDIDLIKEKSDGTVLNDDHLIMSFKNVINSDDVVKLMTLAYQQENFKKADLDNYSMFV